MRMALAIAMLLCPLASSIPAAAQSKVNIEQSFADSLTALPKEELAVSGGFYVPAYSSVAMSQGKLRVDFSVTLSVHNASETQALVVKRIGYFDTAGKQVESYLKAPVALTRSSAWSEPETIRRSSTVQLMPASRFSFVTRNSRRGR